MNERDRERVERIARQEAMKAYEAGKSDREYNLSLILDAVDDPLMWVVVWSGEFDDHPFMITCLMARAPHAKLEARGGPTNLGILLVRKSDFGPLDMALLFRSFDFWPIHDLKRMADVLTDRAFIPLCRSTSVPRSLEAETSFASFLKSIRSELNA